MRPTSIICLVLVAFSVSCGSTTGVTAQAEQRAGLFAPTRLAVEKDVGSTQALMYVSDGNCSCVQVYLQKTGALVRLISNGVNGPNGVATDGQGNLWVANNNTQSVTVYAPGASSPFKTLSVPGEYPYNVVVADDGTAYVSSVSPTPSVFVYANGSTTPTSMLFDNRATYAYALGLDKRGDLYWVATTSSRAWLDEFIKAKGQPIRLTYLHGGDLYMTFDGADHLLMSNQHAVAEIELPNTFLRELAHSGTPYGLALNRFNRLFVADHFTHAIKVYDYPSGELIRRIPTGAFYPTGLAVYPRASLTY